MARHQTLRPKHSSVLTFIWKSGNLAYVEGRGGGGTPCGLTATGINPRGDML